MWIPGSGESPALSEARDDRPLLRPCHHKHVAVCQQETLAFIELQPPVTPKINGLTSPKPTPDTQRTARSLNGFKHTLNAHNGHYKSDTDSDHETNLNSDSQAQWGNDELEDQNGTETDTSSPEKTERSVTVTTICRPLHAALSLPLSLPLSSLYKDRDSWDSQLPGSPSSPEGPDSCQPQRRASQGSLREKSIRKYISMFC